MEETKEKGILKALFEIQSKIKPLKKDSSNPFMNSKYASLEGIWEVLQPALREQSLLVVQVPTSDKETVSLKTIIYHIPTGEKMEFEPLVLVPSKADPQGYGSAITYARRYTLMSILGLVAEGEDDDANASSGKEYRKIEKAEKPKETSKDDVSKQIFAKLLKIFPAGEGNEGKIDFSLWGHCLKRTGKKLSSTKIIELTDEEKDWLLNYVNLLEKIVPMAKTKEAIDEALNALEFAYPDLYEHPENVQV
jgi:hypothetical protein